MIPTLAPLASPSTAFGQWVAGVAAIGYDFATLGIFVLVAVGLFVVFALFFVAGATGFRS